MFNKIIKVCGLKHPDSLTQITNTKADWLGFIFYDGSPRCVPPNEYVNILNIKGPNKVGVFVNASVESIISIARQCGLTMIQLHGDEDADFCEKLKNDLPVIKAISIKNIEDVALANQYDGKVDYLLFDTKKTGQYGGTGEKFNWTILSKYAGRTPFLLSGGIRPEDLVEIKQFQHDLCIGYDINSGFEIEPGKKDIEQVTEFINGVKNN